MTGAGDRDDNRDHDRYDADSEGGAASGTRDDPGRRPAVALLITLTGFAIVVVVQAALGFAGLLTVAPAVVAVLLLALLGGALAFALLAGAGVHPPASFRAARAEAWRPEDWAGALALLTALCERSWAGLHRSTFLYDVLSYHLHLPAAWRAAGRIGIVPTPFGDPAAAYAPSNAELVYHLLLAWAGNARLAHAGQIPFAALALLALYTTARTLNASRAGGFAAALAFLLIPEIWQQAPTAMADLALAAFFLASVPFLLRLRRARRWPDVIGLGLALGLVLGTKYVSVVLSLPLLAWAAMVFARRPGDVSRIGAATMVAALMLGCGGFWYVRNLLTTGNPLFPATIRIGPVTVAQGLYDAALIRTSAYHLAVTDVKALLDIVLETGWGFLGAVIVAAFAVRPARWLVLAVVILFLLWFVVPYQQSRFFFSLWGVGVIVLAVAAVDKPRVGVIALATATTGSVLQFPTPGRLMLMAVAACGAVLSRVWGPSVRRALRGAVTHLPRSVILVRRGPRRVIIPVALSLVVALPFAAVIGWARVTPADPVYVVGDAHDHAWSWVRAHVRGKRVAYTGSNLPLPLWGPRFDNVVRYVAVAGGPRSAPHDFLNVPAAARTRQSAEPAPEREFPEPGLWLSNLRAWDIQVLFVAALYPGVQETIAHDPSGFPIERSWADADPQRFPLLFANEGVRIYEYRPDGRPRP